MKSRRWWAIAAVVFGLGLAGLWVWTSQSDAHPKILVLLPSRENPFWVEVREGAEEARRKVADRYDVQIVASSDLDAADQVAQLRDASARNVAGVVIGIADSRAPAPAIAELNRKNIPVVLIDTPLDQRAAEAAGAVPDAFIGSDNRQGGQLAAEAMAQALAKTPGRKRVLLIKGSYVHKSAIDRAEGFIAGAKGRFDIVERDGEWSQQRANEQTSALIARENIDGIFASNDDMALGAVAALDNAKLTINKRPIVIGFDATAAGREAIEQGKMYASVGQQTKRMGQEGIARLIGLLDGQPVKADELVPVELVKKKKK